MSQSRILVVDDDPDICRILRGYLEQAGMFVFVANDGETALHTLRRERPDVLVLDLMLPRRDGLDVTRVIRSDDALAATPIIMLTARVDDADKIVGLEMGADDYVTKPFNAREVVARVRAQLRRKSLDQSKPSSLIVAGELRIDVEHYEVTRRGAKIDLTPTEFKILHTLALNANHTITRDELIEQAMGYAYEGLGRALDTHMRNLRTKLEDDPKDPRTLITAHGIGYRFVTE